MSAPDDDLVVGRHRIPKSELAWDFTPTGGPGGQHANRSNTRVELRFDLASSAVFGDGLTERMLSRLGPRAVNGVVIVVADDSRSQWRNRSIALRRLRELLEASMKTDPPRRPTRPTKASRRRRLDEKRARSQIKRDRRRPDQD